ncbi:GLUG motif-containing protein [Sedimentibacter sp. B4]|uniref:GLUG motif-containing protein n=1 Tax=Sedimentibacter sp. B4 TaxID=304766 RepID=UPI000306E405|nr:GLUG motif-containing protein [Sedimentibacter sp. B4]
MKKIILLVLIMMLLTSACTKNVQNTVSKASGNVAKEADNNNTALESTENVALDSEVDYSKLHEFVALNTEVDYSNLNEFVKQYEKFAGGNLNDLTPVFFTIGILHELNKDEEFKDDNFYTMPYEKVKEMAPLFFNDELIKYYENDLYASDFNTYKDIILEPFEICDSGKEISVLYGRFINDEEGRCHWLYPVRYTVEPYILNEDEIPLIFSDVFKDGEQRYRILNVENYDFKMAEEIYSSNGYSELFEQKEYEIYSPEDIIEMSKRVNSKIYNELNATYILKNDIDMSNVDGFLPIGKSNSYKYPDHRDPNSNGFSGILEGNNYTISNLTYMGESSDSDLTEFIGFFSILGKGAHIKNLNIENAKIGYKNECSNVSAGILAGRIICTKIENCSVSGTVKGIYDVGGLVGSSSFDLEDIYSEIINCKADVEVFGENWIGGLLGSDYRTIVRNCNVEGIVTCDKFTNSANMPIGIGGLIGHNIEAEIRNCGADVWVKTMVNASCVGSFAGLNEGYTYGCFYNSDISNWKAIGDSPREEFQNNIVGLSNDEYSNRMLIYPEFYPLFEKATEAWGWFWVDTMPLEVTYAYGPNGEITVEHKEYNEVDYKGIETLKDLENYLKTIFSDEKVEGMLKSGRYFDVDGKLCTVAMGRGTNNSYGKIVEVNKNIINDTKIEYIVHVEKFGDYQELKGYEEFTFVYEKEGDRWVFTEFPAWW